MNQYSFSDEENITISGVFLSSDCNVLFINEPGVVHRHGVLLVKPVHGDHLHGAPDHRQCVVHAAADDEYLDTETQMGYNSKSVIQSSKFFQLSYFVPTSEMLPCHEHIIGSLSLPLLFIFYFAGDLYRKDQP